MSNLVHRTRYLILFGALVSITLPLTGEEAGSPSEPAVAPLAAPASEDGLDPSTVQDRQAMEPENGRACIEEDATEEWVPLTCTVWPHVQCKNQSQCQNVCEPGDGYCIPVTGCCIC